MEGLRERKRRKTHDTISATAISLFLERGYDQVSVADIADAADVSKPTLFRYFPTKEDLVVHRFADHQGEAARVVQGRPDGVTPLDALHRHFVDGLEKRDPVTGLNDHPGVLAYHRMVFSTPGLVARLTTYVAADEGALAAAFVDAPPLDGTEVSPVAAALAAAQVIAVQRVLARRNWAELNGGRSADNLYPDALAAADSAFTYLRTGLPV